MKIHNASKWLFAALIFVLTFGAMPAMAQEEILQVCSGTVTPSAEHNGILRDQPSVPSTEEWQVFPRTELGVLGKTVDASGQEWLFVNLDDWNTPPFSWIVSYRLTQVDPSACSNLPTIPADILQAGTLHIPDLYDMKIDHTGWEAGDLVCIQGICNVTRPFSIQEGQVFCIVENCMDATGAITPYPAACPATQDRINLGSSIYEPGFCEKYLTERFEFADPQPWLRDLTYVDCLHFVFWEESVPYIGETRYDCSGALGDYRVFLSVTTIFVFTAEQVNNVFGTYLINRSPDVSTQEARVAYANGDYLHVESNGRRGKDDTCVLYGGKSGTERKGMYYGVCRDAAGEMYLNQGPIEEQVVLSILYDGEQGIIASELPTGMEFIHTDEPPNPFDAVKTFEG